MHILHPSLELFPLRKDIYLFYKSNNKMYEVNEHYIKFYNLFSYSYYHLIKKKEAQILLQAEDIGFLHNVLAEVTHPYIKIVVYMFLNNHNNEKINPKIILDEYSKYYGYLINYNIIPNEVFEEHEIKGALDLLLKSNQHDNYPIILEYPFYLSQLRKADADFGISIPLDVIIKVDKNNRFSKQIYKRIMHEFNNLIDCEKFIELPSSYLLFESMLLCAKRIDDKSLEKKIENQKKEFLIFKIEKSKPNSFPISLLKALEKMPITEAERQYVHKQMQKTTTEMSKHMKPIKMPIDESIQEDLESLFQEFERKIKNTNSLIEALLFITEEFSPISKKEIDEFNNNHEGTLLTSMFTKHTIGEDGFFTNNISENYSFLIDFHCKLILQTIRILKKYYTVKREDLLPLVTNNIFVPEKFIYLFIEGIYKIIELDLFTASRFIILNSETLIKHIANLQGIIIKRQKKDYYEDKITIEQILEDERFINATSADIAYNLNLILYKDEGFKLRHRVAHGILNDSESQNIVPLLSLLSLWLKILFRGKLETVIY